LKLFLPCITYLSSSSREVINKNYGVIRTKVFAKQISSIYEKLAILTTSHVRRVSKFVNHHVAAFTGTTAERNKTPFATSSCGINVPTV